MSSKEVLFIHPPSPMLEVEGVVPPLAPLLLGDRLKKAGHKVKVYDAIEGKINMDRVLDTGVLLVTSTTPQYPEVLKVMERINEDKARTGIGPITVIGGAHATYMGERLLEDGWDHICIGPGDEAVGLIVDGRYNPGSVIFGARPSNIDKYYPDYSLVDINRYRRPGLTKPTAPIITSIGCPFDCAFCSNEVYGRQVQMHSVDYVVRNVQMIKDLGIDQIVVYDDLFTANPERVKEICQKLPEGVLWRANAHVNTIAGSRFVRSEMLMTMREAGCVLLSLGVDGYDDPSLEYLRKGTTIDRCQRAVFAVKNSGIMVKTYMIYIPGGGMAAVEKMIGFIFETDPDFVQVSGLVPLPGSPMYDRSEDFGLHLDKSKIESFYYCGAGGTSGDIGLMSEEDHQALSYLSRWLATWRAEKPDMPI